MKKQFILYLVILYISITASFGQVGQWTWIHGSSTPGQSGNFGTKGVPNASNEPPALYEVCEWTDLNGNFWMYGGADESYLTHNDLWEYNPITNMWIWMNGTNTPGDPGNYGVRGVPSASNRPPCRGWGAASWIDLNGNLWMFGGRESGLNGYNDLWMYNISSNIWTWVAGSNTAGNSGNYGAQGVPNITNYPPARCEAAARWIDNNGDLWLWGGTTSALGVALNDLWRYNIASNTWTWMKGSNTTGQAGIYGVMGTENAANTPGNRWVHCSWKDNSGNFWLFGGFVDGTTPQNDLWRYNPVSNNWTWMNGSSNSNTPGVYGTKCVTNATNSPGGRYESRSAWVDNNGNFWMFGGIITSISGTMNDLWMYCVSSNQWTWEGGDNTSSPIGNWGVKGISSPTNRPGGRMGSVGWTDHKGNLFVFGGLSDPWPTMYNDLWVFAIDTNCSTSCTNNVIPPVANFLSSDSTLCTYDCINYTDKSTNATSWQWSFSGGSPSSSSDKNPQNICYLTAGTFDVTLIVSNSSGSDTLMSVNIIKVFASPPTPVITQHNDTLYCSTDPSYTSYQWYDGSTLIPGATDTILIISHIGNYNVAVHNENDCQISVGINVGSVGFNEFSADNSIALYPNPVSNELLVSGNWKSETGKVKINILNVLGQIIYTEEINGKQAIINCKRFASGMYFLQLKAENRTVTKRFVKE